MHAAGAFAGPVDQSRSTAMPSPETTSSTDLRASDFSIFGGDYSAQIRSGFRPRMDVAALPLELPLDWNMDPFKDSNWRFQLSAWRMLNPIWSKWYGKDWQRLQQEVVPWIDDWSRYHLEEGKTSAFEWYDMAAGLRAQNLAMVFWLQGQGKFEFGKEQERLLRRLAAEHVLKLRDPAYINSGNHGIFQIHGLRLLCIASKIPECAGEESYSSARMKGLFDSQFDVRGVQTENSPSYHLFALKAFAKIRAALYPGMATHFQSTLEKAGTIAPWFTEPDGSIVQIGDSEGRGMEEPLEAMIQSSPFAEEGSRSVVADLHKSGYVIIRSRPDVDVHDASMLVVSGVTSRTKVHDHADELSFVLFSRGRYLFVDPGKYTYNNNDWRRYFVSDRAHNVAGLEGISFAPTDTVESGSTLTSLTARSGGYAVSGCVHRGQKFEHCRRYVYLPHDKLIVHDDIESLPAAARPAIYWHLAPGLLAKAVSGGFSITDRDGSPLARMLVDEPDCHPSLISGATKPLIQGWVSRGYQRKEKAVVIKYVCNHGTRNMTTRILLGGTAF